MADEQTYSQSMSVEQVQAIVEQRVQAAVDEGSNRVGLEIAEPENMWNLWAIGPFQQPAINGPFRPGKVVRTSETFFVATVLWLNPNFIIPPGITACELISNMADSFELDYCTADLCRVRPATQFSRENIKVKMVGGRCFFVNVQRFQAPPGSESCLYEMNICCRILGCASNSITHFAGYATAVFDLDADVFYPRVSPPTPPVPTPTPPSPAPGRGPRWKFDQPIRFMVY